MSYYITEVYTCMSVQLAVHKHHLHQQTCATVVMTQLKTNPWGLYFMDKYNNSLLLKCSKVLL